MYKIRAITEGPLAHYTWESRMTKETLHIQFAIAPIIAGLRLFLAVYDHDWNNKLFSYAFYWQIQ